MVLPIMTQDGDVFKDQALLAANVTHFINKVELLSLRTLHMLVPPLLPLVSCNMQLLSRQCMPLLRLCFPWLSADVASSSAGGPLRPSADALRNELFRAGLISGGGSSNAAEPANQAAAAAADAAPGEQQGRVPVFEEDSEEDMLLPTASGGGYGSASGVQFGGRGHVRPYQAKRGTAYQTSGPGATSMVQQQEIEEGLEVPEDIMLPVQVGGRDTFNGLQLTIEVEGSTCLCHSFHHSCYIRQAYACVTPFRKRCAHSALHGGPDQEIAALLSGSELKLAFFCCPSVQ